MRMNSAKITFMILISCFWLTSAVFAQGLDLAQMQDDGTGPDGVMILPKGMALRCGLSARDGRDSEKISACLDHLVALTKDNAIARESAYEIMTDIIHQLSQEYLVLALENKADSGDVEDKIEEETGKDMASTAKDKQLQSTNLSAKKARNINDLTRIYSALLFLQSMDGYYKLDFSRRQVETEK